MSIIKATIVDVLAFLVLFLMVTAIALMVMTYGLWWLFNLPMTVFRTCRDRAA